MADPSIPRSSPPASSRSTPAGDTGPPTADVAIEYRNYWYDIDERDQATKTTFALMLQLSRLDFGLQEATSGPFLTLPISR